MSSKFHCLITFKKTGCKSQRTLSKEDLDYRNRSCFDRLETLRAWLVTAENWFSRLAIMRKNNLKTSAVSRITIKWCRTLFATFKDILSETSSWCWQKCDTSKRISLRDFRFLRARKSSVSPKAPLRNRKCQRRRKRKWKTFILTSANAKESLYCWAWCALLIRYRRNCR